MHCDVTELALGPLAASVSLWNAPGLASYTDACVAPHRGKGDYFRLGHGSDVHVRKPQVVEGLRGKKIVHVAVGALHCLAVTDAGQVSRERAPYSSSSVTRAEMR